KVKVIKTAAGDRIKTGEGLALTTLWPPAEFSASDPNDLSVVLLLDFSSLDVLLTGDANIQTGFYNNVGQEIDILKVAHHGSRTGTDEEFLDKVRPRLAVISVGKNNSYGHPHSEAMKILRDKDIKILRTDEDGEVEVVSDGQSWSVKSRR
ncbi:hypothetical protein HYW66_02160, partial [Candidatus Microgenomates bacterium]|nr:hypothetical protein [Candidatus Microgenomates bacterium]